MLLCATDVASASLLITFATSGFFSWKERPPNRQRHQSKKWSPAPVPLHLSKEATRYISYIGFWISHGRICQVLTQSWKWGLNLHCLQRFGGWLLLDYSCGIKLSGTLPGSAYQTCLWLNLHNSLPPELGGSSCSPSSSSSCSWSFAWCFTCRGFRRSVSCPAKNGCTIDFFYIW